MSDQATKKSFKEHMINFFDKLKKFYFKNMSSINTVAGIVLGFLILILIATRGFKDASTLPGGHYSSEAFAGIQWYAVFIMYGIISSILLAYLEFKKKGINTSVMVDGVLICVPAAILGARGYYAIVNPERIDGFAGFFGFSNGSFEGLAGLAIHGGIIAVVLVLIPFCKIKKLNYFALLDIVMPAFLIGQGIGRWGNFMNAELYGPVISSEGYINFLPTFITSQLTVSSTDRFGVLQSGPRHPVFLYESMFNIVTYIVLSILRDKKIFRIGDLTACYLIAYGTIRIPVELLRFNGGEAGDSMLVPWTKDWDSPIPINVVISIVMIVVGLLFIFVRRIIFRKNPQQYFRDYRYEPLKKIGKRTVISNDEQKNNIEDNNNGQDNTL